MAAHGAATLAVRSRRLSAALWGGGQLEIRCSAWTAMKWWISAVTSVRLIDEYTIPVDYTRAAAKGMLTSGNRSAFTRRGHGTAVRLRLRRPMGDLTERLSTEGVKARTAREVPPGATMAPGAAA
jgi:hypothetical protein